MPFYSGQQGKLFIDNNPTPAAKVVSWSFNTNTALLETTTLGDTDKTSIYGVRSMSGKCKLYYYNYGAGASVKNDCGLLLSKAIKTGSAAGDGDNAPSDPVTLKLKLEDGSADGRWLTLPSLITSVSMTMAIGQVLSADISFKVNGAPLDDSNLNSGTTKATVF